MTKQMIVRKFLMGCLVIGLTGSPSLLFAQENESCMACHSDASLAMERKGTTVSLFVDSRVFESSTHAGLSCVDCHAGFDPDNIPHKSVITSVSCLNCHDDPAQTHPFHPKMMNPAAAKKSAAVSCTGCHGTHEITSPKDPTSPLHSSKLTQACGRCHRDIRSVYMTSEHARAYAAGVKGAPNCITCHTQPLKSGVDGADTASIKLAQEKLCLSCHLDDANVRAAVAPTAGFIAAYENSVHGSALIKGNGNAANCVDCHGSHEMKKGVNPSSRVNKMHIAETCAKCHGDIAQVYLESVHGSAVRNGIMDAPACTDCHGEHSILPRSDPSSPVAVGNVSSKVCSPCHNSLKLSDKFGLARNRGASFDDSFHGLAIRGGSVEVANCASCHGSHDIRPSSDPRSMIAKGNLAATCGKCHPGANDRFTQGSVHLNEGSTEEPILHWIATTYLILIVTVTGGMVVHNAFDFIKKSRRKLKIRRGEIIEEHFGHRLYLRMTLVERIQHGALLVSFIVLVFTGFMLRFPDAWWVQAIRQLSDSIFDLRSLIHRIAAVGMVAASVLHIYYIAFTQRGRELIKDLLPKIQDGRDAIAVVKYNLGFSSLKPKLGRFSYIEKSEYWALVWGTIVMAITGVIMWFDNTFMGLLTKLGYDVARSIHYYEAWLATLAIIVWHFYYVIFNPDTYPINLAFWKGTLTEHEMVEEHPLELEEIKRREMESELSETEQLPEPVPVDNDKSPAQ